MRDYRVTVRVRNNRLLSAIEKRHPTVAAFCRASGINQSELGKLIAMTESPVDRHGDWRLIVVRLCEFMRVMPSDLFTDEQTVALKVNRVDVEMDAHDVSAMLPGSTTDPDRRVELEDLTRAIDQQLATLPDVQRDVIRRRFGLDCEQETIDSIAASLDVSRERVRQIEEVALRKLRHPSRADDVRAAAGISSEWGYDGFPRKDDEGEAMSPRQAFDEIAQLREASPDRQ